MPRLDSLTELRRLLPLTAAALLAAALAVPVWRITLTAPQYTEALVVELYAYPRLGGDYAEVQLLNHYVGFYYPDPVFVEPNYAVEDGAVAVPEWLLGPVVFLALAAAAVFAALAPTARALERRLTYHLGATIAILSTMAVIIQVRLYQAGHSLDSSAPLRGVDGFTPPIAGSYEVANISGNAWFGPGGYMAAVAVAALVVAYLVRGSEATVGDVPDLLRSSLERGRSWLERRREGSVGRDRGDRRDRRDGHEGGPDVDATDATDATDEPTDRTSARGTPRGDPP
ncbi:hypothetical protein [Halomontanus rarus]|uniref:hypothetical protein n=1 Tax=Halomontanus rarus TaxID=3034020 RepID=UPI0023E76F74|nr:hypothetical protein [Halovivax sp. TS33]